MSSFPTIGDVVGYLRGRGMEGMALAVERLEANYQTAHSLNQRNVDAYNALKAKYEPVYRHPTHQAPPESDG